MISARGRPRPDRPPHGKPAGLEPLRCGGCFQSGRMGHVGGKLSSISGYVSDVLSRALSRPRWQALRPGEEWYFHHSGH